MAKCQVLSHKHSILANSFPQVWLHAYQHVASTYTTPTRVLLQIPDNPKGAAWGIIHIPEGFSETPAVAGIGNLYHGNGLRHHFRTIFGHGCGPAAIFSCQVDRTDRSFSLTIAPLQASIAKSTQVRRLARPLQVVFRFLVRAFSSQDAGGRVYSLCH